MFLVRVVLMVCTVSMSAHFNPQALEALKTHEPYKQAMHTSALVKHEKEAVAYAKQEVGTSSQQLSYNNVHACINIAAMVHATVKIYMRLRANASTSTPASSSWWSTLCPQWMCTITSQSSFFVDSVCIVLETLLYKTIAKYIVACASHDIVDVAEEALERGKKVAKKVIAV